MTSYSVTLTEVTATLPHSVDTPKIMQFVNSLSDDILSLTGSKRVICSQKRNPNTASLLFNKFGFAQNNTVMLNQKCLLPNCSSCELKMDYNVPIQLTPSFYVLPSRISNCKSSCVIYVAICQLCFDFYFGQTMSEERQRMNGHRDKFHIDRYDKSALSMHIYTDHPANFDDALGNFKVVILESTNAINLNRRESFYIWATEADIRHLNRYKVVKWTMITLD